MKYLLGVFLLSISCYSAAGVYVGPVSISQIEVSDSFFTLYLNAPIANEGCQEFDKVVLWKSDYPNNYNLLFSTALAAFSSDKKITMWVNGCKNGPWGATLPLPATVVITKN